MFVKQGSKTARWTWAFCQWASRILNLNPDYSTLAKHIPFFMSLISLHSWTCERHGPCDMSSFGWRWNPEWSARRSKAIYGWITCVGLAKVSRAEMVWDGICFRPPEAHRRQVHQCWDGTQEREHLLWHQWVSWEPDRICEHCCLRYSLFISMLMIDVHCLWCSLCVFVHSFPGVSLQGHSLWCCLLGKSCCAIHWGVDKVPCTRLRETAMWSFKMTMFSASLTSGTSMHQSLHGR